MKGWQWILAGAAAGSILTMLVIYGAAVWTYQEPKIQWEFKVEKYKAEKMPVGWEPFGYDKDANVVYLKRRMP